MSFELILMMMISSPILVRAAVSVFYEPCCYAPCQLYFIVHFVCFMNKISAAADDDDDDDDDSSI